MRLIAPLIALAFSAGAVFLAVKAQAAEVQFGYDFLPTGAVQLNGKPIGQSLFSFDFTAPVGPVEAGAMIEADQSGRAGPASDRLSIHVGKTFTAGRVTLEPRLLLGYARGLNADAGLIGAEWVSTYRFTPWLSLESGTRFRHSFAENAAPLNSAELSHASWWEFANYGGPVFDLSSHTALGIKAENDLGTTPDVRIGVFLREQF